MQYGKVTKISIRDDVPTSISSSQHGANLDTMGFNLGFILKRKPGLAVDLFRLYNLARKLKTDDPQAPEEDYNQALEQWDEFMRTAFDAS